MRAVFIIIGAIIVLLLFGVMMSGMDEAKTDERTDSFAAVTTAITVTEADVILVADPFDDSILNIVSITSSNSADAPLPDSYITATNTLTVRGLNDDDSRNLTVVYKYDSLGESSETVGQFFDLIPILLAVAVIGLLLVGGFGAYVYVKGRG